MFFYETSAVHQKNFQLNTFKVIALLLASLPLTSQTFSFADKARKLTATLAVYHYQPIELNASTSADVCDLFISEIDSKGMILTQKNIQSICKNKSALFAEIKAGSNAFVFNASQIYSKALQSTDSILSLLSAKPLDFSESDTAFFLPIGTKTFYSPDIKYHSKRMKRYVKSKSYDKVCTAEDFEKLSEKEFNERANEYSRVIIEHLRHTIHGLMTHAGKTTETSLLNAIALRYDPHSNYFDEEQNSEFNKQLSSTVESFGLFFDSDEDGNVVIGFIEPGGAAWQSNLVNEGDVLISMKVGAALITPEGNTFEHIQEKMDNTSEKRISLTLKKHNGQQKTVKLIKQKTASAENSVKGFVLRKGSDKVGYISLPSFYTDMRDHNLPGCANDVAKEIVKLEHDSIKGLIIDLRNNGGGSMQEAMNLAGIFVDEGPLFILKEKDRNPFIVKDINRGSLFKKPLVVMINEGSASASELFSNIIKDYNIGLIVGQTSYGKGTAQNIIPLDTNALLSGSGTSDYIKITNSKFYRLNATTHQGTGVLPDIELPGLPANAIHSESREKFHLPSDSISKKVTYFPNLPADVKKLKANSMERIKTSEDFKRFSLCSDSVSRILSATQKIALKYPDYKTYKSQTNALFTSFENAAKGRNTAMECLNNTFDKQLSEISEITKEFNDRILESIKKDIFIEESFYIINDLIRQKK